MAGMEFFSLVQALFSSWQVWVATSILLLVFALVKLITSFEKSPLSFGFDNSKGPIAGPEVLDDAEVEPGDQTAGEPEKIEKEE
jgi:hypothetical protein